MITILIILCCSQFIFLNVKAQSSSSPYLILFDEAHDQYYTYTNGRFKTALDYLNQTADFEVILNSKELDNHTELLPYDLIIIGNPGPNGNFTPTEIDSLKNYTENGGNLILLCNYNDVGASPNENITGKFANLNNITIALNLPVLFTSYDLWDNNHNPIGKRWVVEIEDPNFKMFHPIKFKVKKALTFTSVLNVSMGEEIVATGYEDSYLKNITGELNVETPWLFATQVNSSRILLCGSNAMFSDTNITTSTNDTYFGIFWINAVDNLRLWANLIQWTLITEVPDLNTIFLIVISILFAVGVGLIVYNSYFTSRKSPVYDIESEDLRNERATTLKQARARVKEGMYLAAAQLYKKAGKLSNKLKDYPAEKRLYQKHREFLKKSKKVEST